MNVKPYTKKDFAWTQWTATDIKKLIPKILEHKASAAGCSVI